MRKRLQDAKCKEANQITAMKNTTEISSVFNMKPSVEQVTYRAVERAFIKKGLPLDL